jgi:hypothetical protein
MRSAFFACQTQEHTARSKKGADTLTPAFSPLAVARLPASNRSANSGEGALKRFPIRYRHRAEQEVVQTAASYGQLQLSAFSPASLLKWQLERVVSRQQWAPPDRKRRIVELPRPARRLLVKLA